mmetsp:Transcript_65401/g.165702  ORF Transcript_65401/g.165702 Transcript_65401/m.165702 type:complete len:125 (+) Transcript_65401:1-375(+)
MSVLSNGLPRQRDRILALLQSHVQRWARHRFASLVLLEAVELCSDQDGSRFLASELVRSQPVVASLARHYVGAGVLKALAQMPPLSELVLQHLAVNSMDLMRDKYGRELLQDLGLNEQARRMHA